MFTIIRLTFKYFFVCLFGLIVLVGLLAALSSSDNSQSVLPVDSSPAVSISSEPSNTNPLYVEPSVVDQSEENSVASQTPESEHEIDYAGADGHIIELLSNSSAVNPTYDQVISFLKSDTTDQTPYDLDKFACADYAEQVQHNAENAGYKCGWVAIEFENKDKGHACNVFNTTDRGRVFVDCTTFDSVVDIEEGYEYRPVPLSKLLGYNSGVKADPLGVVKSYSIEWE